MPSMFPAGRADPASVRGACAWIRRTEPASSGGSCAGEGFAGSARSAKMPRSIAWPKAPAGAGRLPLMRKLTRGRNVVERCVNRLKDFRAVATRHDKRGYTYLAGVLVASIML